MISVKGQLTISIDGKEITLTYEDAEKLFTELSKYFDRKSPFVVTQTGTQPLWHNGYSISTT